MHHRGALLTALILLVFISMLTVSAAHEEETGQEILESSPLPPVQQPVTPSVEAPPAPPETPKVEKEKPSEEMATEQPSPEELRKIKGGFTFNTAKRKGYFGALSLTVLSLIALVLLVVLL
jgi:hypothetical protein